MPSTLQLIILPAGIIAVLFALYLARDVLSRDTGTKEMQDVAGTIFEGAVAFIRRQYTTIGILAVVGAVVIGVVITHLRDEGRRRHEDRSASTSAGGPASPSSSAPRARWRRGSSACTSASSRTSARPRPRGAASSRRSRSRCAAAPSRASSSSPCRCSASTASSRLFGGLGGGQATHDAPFLIVGFGFGASFVALFAQLGGGIYTKAADVGSDLVGKVEKGIPEDDPRNAGVVADLVGDNVGDCAGRGADLFESTAAENIGAMILGVGVFTIALRPPAGRTPQAWIFFPLVVRAFGLLSTIVAIFFVRGKEDENPMNMLNRGYWVTTILSVVALLLATNVMLQTNGNAPSGLPVWLYFFGAGVVGLATSVAFVYITQYYTAGSFRPVREIAEASKTGPATNIISGTAVGFETTFVTAITIGIALFASHWLGSQAGHRQRRRQGRRRHLRDRRRDDGHAHDHGLHPGDGHLRPDHRQRRRHRRVQPGRGRRPRDHRPARRRRQHDQGPDQGLRDRLGVAGRVPAVQRLHRQGQPDPGRRTGGGRSSSTSVNLANVNVFIAALIGAMLVYFFSSLAIRAVGTTAQAIIVEVRRQFREMPGIMDYTQRPDYARVVDITTRAALREMILPGVVAVATPIIVGLLLGAEAVAGMLMVGTIAGVLLATVLNNGGGAWDNAKKYIESGHLKDDARQRPRQGLRRPRRGRRRRHGRRSVQGHRRPVAPRPRQAAGHDHAGPRPAVHPLARRRPRVDARRD